MMMMLVVTMDTCKVKPSVTDGWFLSLARVPAGFITLHRSVLQNKKWEDITT